MSGVGPLRRERILIVDDDVGLAISYEIVHELGGDLRAANDPATGGACFRIALPLFREDTP